MWYAPGMGKGAAQTLHRNYLLPINSNIGQDEKDAPMAGVENNSASTPAPSVDSEPADADCLGQSHQAQQQTHPNVVQINCST